MTQMSKIEVPVEQEIAAALSDSRRREAVCRLVDRLVRPGSGDRLTAIFERTASKAREAGLTGEENEAELAAYNAEHRT